MSKKSVCIIGGGFTNKGAEAMVLTVADALRNRVPELDIYVTSPFREAKLIKSRGLIPTGRGHPKSVIAHLASAIRTGYIYRTCKALIDVGGYQFGDPWGVKLAARKLRILKRLAARGTPIFFMPQTWGPFSSEGFAGVICQIVDQATVCYVRDMVSMEAMRALCGENHGKIRFAHDIAWNFVGAERFVGERLIRNTGLNRQNHALTVALTPNLRIYERTEGINSRNEYVRSLLHVVKHLCSAHDAQVILVGHELAPQRTRAKDDRMLCALLLSLLDGEWPVVHLDTDFSAADVKSVIGNCDLLVSSRYHALIAALSQGVPVAAIGWSHKYDELLKEVNLQANILSLHESASRVRVHLDLIVKRLPQCQTVIASRVSGLKKSAAEAMNNLVSSIETRV